MPGTSWPGWISAAKAYGVKAVNPAARQLEVWTQREQPHRTGGWLHEDDAGDDLSGLARIADERDCRIRFIFLQQPGIPGNVSTTLETMKVLEGHRAHMAHLQFHAYGGDGWGTLRSEAAAIAEYFNAHPNLTADAGAILFGDAMTVTADGPWEHVLHELTGHKWSNVDVENETGCGIVSYTYKERSLVNAVQWAVGLELLLLIDDPWRIFLTTDHPNGGCFWRQLEIIHLLMSADYRRSAWRNCRPRR